MPECQEQLESVTYKKVLTQIQIKKAYIIFGNQKADERNAQWLTLISKVNDNDSKHHYEESLETLEQLFNTSL